MVSRADTIEPKAIENGVIVAAGLQINEFTLAEHQDYLTWVVSKPRLTRAEAEAVGHRAEEIEAYFGPSVSPTVKAEAMNMFGDLIAVGIVGVADVEAILTPPRDAFHRIAPPARAIAEKATGFDRVKARTMGFTGDVCVNCQSVRMVRNASCLMCQECGTTTGCT